MESHFDSISRTTIAIAKREPFVFWLHNSTYDTIENDLSDNNSFLANDGQTLENVDDSLTESIRDIFEGKLEQSIIHKIL